MAPCLRAADSRARHGPRIGNGPEAGKRIRKGILPGRAANAQLLSRLLHERIYADR